MTNNKSHLTAIPRKSLPQPTLWLIKNRLIRGHVMDYGCGKCASVNPSHFFNYDPFFCNQDLSVFRNGRGYFDTIICNYVLCAMTPAERMPILKDIQIMLDPFGLAFVSVRNDRPKNGWGWTSKGTYQGKVNLSLPTIHEDSRFKIFLLTKDSPL